jgi:hypothetical protein
VLKESSRRLSAEVVMVIDQEIENMTTRIASLEDTIPDD